jgi:MFS family permease
MAAQSYPASTSSTAEPDQALIAEPIPLSSWISVTAMLIASVYSTVDRQIFAIFAESIRVELGLSDVQLGLLQGVGLSFVGLLTVYPISWIADRYDRRKVMAACVLGWSLAVLGCGLSKGFGWLLLFTGLVGIGEAGVGPAGFAIIPDLFPFSARQLGNSVFSIGFRLAASLGVYLAGLLMIVAKWVQPALPGSLAHYHVWRLSFLVTVVFAPIAIACLWFLPRRASGRAHTTETQNNPTDDVYETFEQVQNPIAVEPIGKFLKRHRSAWICTLTAALMMSFGSAALAGWAPIIAQRYFGQNPIQSGEWLAAVGLTSGIAGFVIGTPIIQWLQSRIGLLAPMRALAGSVLLQAILALAMMLSRSVPALYSLWGVQATAGMIGAMATPTILQSMAPIHLRARVFAITTFIGMAGALSYVCVGAISDRLSGVVSYPLLYSACSLGFFGLLLGAALFWRSEPLYLELAMENA